MVEFRSQIEDLIRREGLHPAWGFNHCRRVYLTVKEIAGKHTYDEEIVFFASMLHDIGHYPGYALRNLDHSLRSKGVASNILAGFNLPRAKLLAILNAIERHMFYSEPGTKLEAVLIRDADSLDYLGNIGLVRILSLVGMHEWAATPQEALEKAKSLAEALPGKIQTQAAKRIAVKRKEETLRFLSGLKRQTDNLLYL